MPFKSLASLANGEQELERFLRPADDTDEWSSEEETLRARAPSRPRRGSTSYSEDELVKDTIRILRTSSRKSLRRSTTRDASDSDRRPTRASSLSTQRELRKQKFTLLSNQRKAEQAAEASEDELHASEGTRRSTRSMRSGGPGKFQMLQDSDDDLVISDLVDSKHSRKHRASRSKRSRGRYTSDSEAWSDDDANKRRSGRTKKQKINYEEPGMDDEMAVSNVLTTVKPRVRHSKEIFPVLESDDEFVRVHNQVCATCQDGSNRFRGRLVHCQGCSMSYHKDCIGPRSAHREHLVTKISDENFVLQCRRCVGRPRQKDKLAPATDRCTECYSQGRSCEPFKSLKHKKAELSLDERSVTPPTDVAENRLYNAKNILFRCAHCFRAWHYHHLPERNSFPTSGSLWEQRVEQYTEDFTCKVCTQNTLGIQNLVAWRPTDPKSRKKGDEIALNDFNEDEREYLVRFKEQSYFHVKWLPGPWVWGTHQQMRTAFGKKNSPAEMTTRDAIPEDWLRIEICFDVEYDSFVPSGKDVEVDLARIREVTRALVKYRGLTYEDVLWEEPPKESDKERWEEWRTAYDDWVHGQYVHLARGTIKRAAKARSTRFEELERKEQPKYIKGPKGGSLMDYQKEGMKYVILVCRGRN